MGEGQPTERRRVDERGIRPARVYAIAERPAPDGVVVLALQGEFDIAAAPATRQAFEQALARGPSAVVVDLSGVTFADSSALRELLRADAAMRAAGTPFVPAAPTPTVNRLLEITRAEELLAMAPTVDEALRRLGRPR
jgi:anti-sigma B factor antagonist